MVDFPVHPSDGRVPARDVGALQVWFSVSLATAVTSLVGIGACVWLAASHYWRLKAVFGENAWPAAARTTLLQVICGCAIGALVCGVAAFFSLWRAIRVRRILQRPRGFESPV